MRLAVLVIAASLSSTAQAALVSLCGTSVCYEYQNDPAQNPGIALLGAPTLLGNSNVLRFLPTAFRDQAAGGQSSVEAAFHFSRVWSPHGVEIDSIAAVSLGDYQALGGGTASVGLSLTAVDQAHDGGGPGFPESVSANGAFGPAGGTGLPFLNWNLDQSVNPADAFADLATSVSLTIAARLDSLALGAEDGVFLAQKLLLVSAATVVPAPSALPLALTGLAGLLGFRGRRARKSRAPCRRTAV